MIHNNHSIFYIVKTSEVYMHLLAATFIDYNAISQAVILVCFNNARAAHQANSPPLPTPITSSTSITFPVPSNSTIKSLSITNKVAYKCRSCLPVRHCLAYVMHDFKVCFGYLAITVYRPSMRENASANDPANPQQTSSTFLIFFASILTLVEPQLTCPSPIITVDPLRFTAKIVVWCHLSYEKRCLTTFRNMIMPELYYWIRFVMINESADNSQPPSTITNSTVLPHNNKREAINGNGVHSRVQLVLVCVLVLLSLSSVFTSTEGLTQHVRYLSMYFNLNLLGNSNQGLYEQGDNIDEADTQVVSMTDLTEHLRELFNVSSSYGQKGMARFQKQDRYEMNLQVQLRNGSFQQYQFKSIEAAYDYFHHLQPQFMRNFLMRANQFQIGLFLGDNKFLNNFKIWGKYSIHSFLMVEIQLQYLYDVNSAIQTKLLGLRTSEQVVAALLFIIYAYRLLKHYKWQQIKNKKNHDHQNQLGVSTSNGWLMSLCFLSVVVMLSSKWAPLAACLQLLPIFQFPEEKGGEMYNFNKNLRFSLPLILTIYLQLFIFLNGFIFYSMLMYPGEYFDDYFLGFFSYVYQMFQVGTYQIFTQLQSHGNFAYLLYALLYFYVFQVGNSLIPALFCILIQMRITQRDIHSFTQQLVSHAPCPSCQQSNGHQLQPHQLQIFVTSPKLSPLITQKKLTKSPKTNSKRINQPIVLFIEQQNEHNSPSQLRNKFNMNELMTGYSRRIQILLRKLNNLVGMDKGEEWQLDCQRRFIRVSFLINCE